MAGAGCTRHLSVGVGPIGLAGLLDGSGYLVALVDHGLDGVWVEARLAGLGDDLIEALYELLRLQDGVVAEEPEQLVRDRTVGVGFQGIAQDDLKRTVVHGPLGQHRHGIGLGLELQQRFAHHIDVTRRECFHLILQLQAAEHQEMGVHFHSASAAADEFDDLGGFRGAELQYHEIGPFDLANCYIIK